ncbi:Wzz/FepE/Etk N-terminal domain-containing protein [Thermodesulfobacterium hveragerdense]|uniref:Wzz/FepE/Etk N-terminal domain-containing protein n=1 Tax=Thermodesulfobacterium hveragerdense TaxID=53424 RepID=UPI000405B977|nr:Wzz/FepE/Etk N-terminal domain-containing protein [Thermodesulfobacterium hveragerdense]
MNEKAVKNSYDDEINLYELLFVLKKRVKLIAGIVFVGVLLATIGVFLKPNIYQARATVWVDLFFTPALNTEFADNLFKGVQ